MKERQQQKLFTNPNSVEELLSVEQKYVSTAFRVALPSFEGPLDLLLHLIREHRVDILDIPIALITDKYLEVIKVMEELDLDVAGEFLVMAATLTHIKSRMLLPDPEPVADETEPQIDPRVQLIRRLLDFQKYKAAAEELARRELLGRNVFVRGVAREELPLAEGEIGLMEVSVFKLVESLSEMLKNVKAEASHQVFVERVSLSEAITGIIEQLQLHSETTFRSLLPRTSDRLRMVISFLAMLEMCKLRLIRIWQNEGDAEIRVAASDPEALKEELIHVIKDDYL